MRIGVSGVGSIGQRHVRLLRDLPGVTVTVFDAVAPDLPGGIAVVETFPALLDAGLDGLVVATPDAAHAEQTVEAVRRAIPVLVEKPLADSLAAAREVADAARRHKAPVLVGYVLRHYAVAARVREILADGAIGTPVSAHASLGAYETLRLARNRFAAAADYRLPYDYSHEWDYLQWFLGPIDQVAAVAREAGELPLSQHPNLINGVFTMSSGVTGTFHLDYVQDGGGRRLEVVGDRGTLRADLAGGSVRVRAHGGNLTREYDCAEHRDAAFTRQLGHFQDVITGLSAPLVTVHDGVRAIAVADAVVAACRSGGWQPVAA
ncbi:Gfo/Idh/MocA family oxidoreductase [Dactylosporangium sp. NPDC000555]|uniref:Gfo/Idh/MocA family protein n=1 Tax=Dactylosporangium sp. NPDC000555 TaxID=3154260 RepID=UPI00331E2D96